MKKIMIVTGQTATGKTSLALSLANHYGGDIISADSRQLYKYLDIITGKDIGSSMFTEVTRLPCPDEYVIGYYTVNSIRIWGYDIVSPKTHFSSHSYKHVAHVIINNAIDKNSIPIVVGGTFFYIKHLLEDVNINSEPNWTLRHDLEKKTVPQLQKELMNISPNTFMEMNHSDRNNPRRLIRKIEIERSGSTNSTSFKSPYTIESCIGLKFTSRDHLRLNIKRRVEERLAAGAEREVKSLLEKGFLQSDPGLNTIGYTQLLNYLEGTLSYDQAIEQWINAEVQYAKRQYTLMKKDPRITWKEV